MTEVLRLYPDNIIVWVHMGLSQELVNMNAASAHPNDEVAVGSLPEADVGYQPGA